MALRTEYLAAGISVRTEISKSLCVSLDRNMLQIVCQREPNFVRVGVLFRNEIFWRWCVSADYICRRLCDSEDRNI